MAPAFGWMPCTTIPSITIVASGRATLCACNTGCFCAMMGFVISIYEAMAPHVEVLHYALWVEVDRVGATHACMWYHLLLLLCQVAPLEHP